MTRLVMVGAAGFLLGVLWAPPRGLADNSGRMLRAAERIAAAVERIERGCRP